MQDEGAQLVARAAQARPGERVLDLCASPGGKSVVLAHDLDLENAGRASGTSGPSGTSSGSVLVSADFRSARVALLARLLSAARIPALVVQLDARTALPFRDVFDCVLVDAPCSGLGTLCREPDLKWTRTADDLPLLSANAGRMLRSAAEAVRPGGRLVYATCSSEPEENGQVVDEFLSADPRFVERPVGSSVPLQLTDEQGRLATRPDRSDIDAFFAAVLVRREGT